MPPKVLRYTRNTISPTLPMRPTKPSSHPTKTPLTSTGLQWLPYILQVSQSNAGSAMLQPAPYVRNTSSPAVFKAFANRASMADASRHPDYAINLATFAPANESSYLVELVTYQEYSPCQLILQDYTFNASNGSGSAKNSNNPVFSNIFAISVQSHSAGVTWSAENPAPEQTSTDGIGGSASKSAAGHILPMAHASLVGVILIGLIF